MSKLSYRFDTAALEALGWYRGSTVILAGATLSAAARQASAQAKRGEAR